MDKIEVYHAGTERIETPLSDKGRKNLDFGQGFYLTDIYDQALVWGARKSRERQLPALINIYLLDQKEIFDKARILRFDHYDEEWLDFIVGCRAGKDISPGNVL